VHRKEEGGIRIESTGNTSAGNPRARFFVEPSKEHEGWVHIRYSYNNTYWVLVLDIRDNTWYLSAAHEPNEVIGSESCTLFEPILYDDRGRIR
jgi:hypothetical protein